MLVESEFNILKNKIILGLSALVLVLLGISVVVFFEQKRLTKSKSGDWGADQGCIHHQLVCPS